MKIAILYSSSTPGDDYVKLADGLYVRHEIASETCGLDEALDETRPRDNEVVLNTVEIPD